MKKIFIAAAFVAFCSVGSALAQAPATQSNQTKPAAASTSETKKDSHGTGAACCSKKSAAKSCGSEAKAAGKSSCCQKGGHTDAKAEGTTEENVKKN